MKKIHLLFHEEVKVLGSAARWRRSSRSARLALRAALVLLLLAGVAPAATARRPPAFKYNYRVLEVYLYGVFTTTSTMGNHGEDITFNGKEEIAVWGRDHGMKLEVGDPPHIPNWLYPMEGTLTLQSPPSDIGVNGFLQTSKFKRHFVTQGSGIDGEGKHFSCGETIIDDFEGFGGAMRLSGTDKVKVHWVLPGVGYKCGPVTVNYNDQNRLKRIEGDPAESSADDPNQEAQTYPLSDFRQKRFELKIDITHSWEPDYATKANVVWEGRVVLERIEN